MKQLSIFLLLLSLIGCVALPIPHERKITPLYFGQVMDAESHDPIEGVAVSVKLLWTNPKTSDVLTNMTKTDSYGNYEIGLTESATWFFLWLVPAEGVCSGVITFHHAGYQVHKYESNSFGGSAVNGVCTMKKIEYDALLEREEITQSPLKDSSEKIQIESVWH